MAGFDGIDPMHLAEMTEVELANKLTADEIVHGEFHFRDLEARRISLLKVINNVNKLGNEILDNTMPKKKWHSFILRRNKQKS